MLFAHWIIGFGTAGQSFVVSCNCIQLSCCCCIQNQNRLHLPHRNVVCDRQCIGDNKTGGMDHPREVSNAGLGSLHNNMWTLWVHTLCMSIRNKHYLRLLVFWLPPSQLLGWQQHVYIQEIVHICKFYRLLTICVCRWKTNTTWSYLNPLELVQRLNYIWGRPQ